MIHIRKSLSAKLSLIILILAVPIFIVSLGILFYQSRYIIRTEAIGRANSVLGSAMQRVTRKIMTIETATNANAWLVCQYLQPDSLLAISHRVVRFNPHVDGCSISTEPDVFPELGKWFSVYSLRRITDGVSAYSSVTDSIISVREEVYDYFSKIWYKKPRELRKPCWVNYFDESDTLSVTLEGMITSYSVPLYRPDGRFIGIISTDFSLKRLSKIISNEKPAGQSYFVMIDGEGRYFVHPDSTRLFNSTLFSEIDPNEHADIIALGHEMTTGKEGSMSVMVDGVPCLVCYKPVPGTSWSLAFVCPDSEILEGYHQQTYIVVPLLVVGLVIILLLCHRTVTHTIKPIDQLLLKTQSIAAGNLEVYIPHSQRPDAIGRLQNSFSTMLQSLNFHMGSVRYTTDQTRLRNEELAQATRMVEEADRQKTSFIQNVSHQIRTPLNIIMGFSQILGDTGSSVQSVLPEEELKSITDTMNHNSKLLNRMVKMLFDSSETGLNEELSSHKLDMVSCNQVAREAISYVALHYPSFVVDFQTEVDDNFCIQTNGLYLMRSMREILYNSAKYSDGNHIMLRVELAENSVRFILEDTGKGIDEADRERMFSFFAKIDDLSEGLGLGLPLAKRHACNLGGDLTLDDSYHDGCRFVIEIPCKQV